MARLFFAVWPDDSAARALSRLAGEVAGRTGGRAVAPDNIHLTLAFLGEVPEPRIHDLEAIARAAAGEAFELAFDRLGSFRKARVAWIGCGKVPTALAALESRLGAGLRAAGFELEDRPYAPHVTLARKIERRLAAEATPEIAWRAQALELVRTEFGKGKYSRLAAWALR